MLISGKPGKNLKSAMGTRTRFERCWGLNVVSRPPTTPKSTSCPLRWWRPQPAPLVPVRASWLWTVVNYKCTNFTPIVCHSHCFNLCQFQILLLVKWELMTWRCWSRKLSSLLQKLNRTNQSLKKRFSLSGLWVFFFKAILWSSN